jgi:hypothetical protein
MSTCIASGTCVTVESEMLGAQSEGGEGMGATDHPADWDEDVAIAVRAPVRAPSPVSSERNQPTGLSAAAAVSILPVLGEPQRTAPCSAHYCVAKSVVGSGGGQKTSTHCRISSTQGQSTDLSRRESTSYLLVPGYWSRRLPSSPKYGVYLPLVIRNR